LDFGRHERYRTLFKTVFNICSQTVRTLAAVLRKLTSLKRASRSLAKTGFLGRVPVQARALFSGNKVPRFWVHIWGSLWGALGEAFGLLWAPFGSPWGTFGPPWAPLGALFGTLGLPGDTFRDTWVRSWGPGCPREGSGGHFWSPEATFAVDGDEI